MARVLTHRTGHRELYIRTADAARLFRRTSDQVTGGLSDEVTTRRSAKAGRAPREVTLRRMHDWRIQAATTASWRILSVSSDNAVSRETRLSARATLFHVKHRCADSRHAAAGEAAIRPTPVGRAAGLRLERVQSSECRIQRDECRVPYAQLRTRYSLLCTPFDPAPCAPRPRSSTRAAAHHA
jgi:hypothetical protein